MKKFITITLILTTIASVFAQNQYPETAESVIHNEKPLYAMSDSVGFMQQFQEEQAREAVDEFVLALQEVPGNEDSTFYYTAGAKVARYTYGAKLPEWFAFNGNKSARDFVLEELRTRKGGVYVRSTLNKKSVIGYILQMSPISNYECMFTVMSIEIEAFTSDELKEERWQKYIETGKYTLYTK